MKWQMKFNIKKCTLLRIETNNDRAQYAMNGQRLSAVNGKDLGITILSDLKPSQHCSEVFKTTTNWLASSGASSKINQKKLY